MSVHFTAHGLEFYHLFICVVLLSLHVYIAALENMFDVLNTYFPHCRFFYFLYIYIYFRNGCYITGSECFLTLLDCCQCSLMVYANDHSLHELPTHTSLCHCTLNMHMPHFCTNIPSYKMYMKFCHFTDSCSFSYHTDYQTIKCIKYH